MTKRSYSDVSAPGYNANGLLDVVMARCKLKNDHALSITLEIAPSMISKIRHHALPVGPSVVLRIHEQANMPVALIREYLGMPPASKMEPTK